MLKFGNSQYELSPLSYVIVNYRNSIEIYNYEKDEYSIVEDEADLNTNVVAINKFKNYTIDMSVDSLTTPKKKQLLITSINNLNEFRY